MMCVVCEGTGSCTFCDGWGDHLDGTRCQSCDGTGECQACAGGRVGRPVTDTEPL